MGAIFLDQQKLHADLSEEEGGIRWKTGYVLPHSCPAWNLCHGIMTQLIETCVDIDSLVDTDTNYKDQLL